MSQREASICSIHAKDLEGNLLVLLPRPNPLKSKIDDRQQVFGVWCSTASPIVAEILGQSDFDFVIFDAEHAPNDISSLLSQLHSFQRARPEPILRVPHNDIATFKRMSDLGFRSFLVPFVQNEEEARRAVAGVLYPPDGMRGLAPTRSASFGDDVRYVAEANSNVQLILQIETREALRNAKEIISVEGVDGLFLGPGDLAADMGGIGHGLGYPAVRDALQDIAELVQRAGKFCGTVASEDEIAFCLDAGCQLLAVGSDIGFLKKGAAELWKASSRKRVKLQKKS